VCRIAEKQYDEHARNIARESIILTFVKTIFECVIEKMELAVILILSFFVSIYIRLLISLQYNS